MRKIEVVKWMAQNSNGVDEEESTIFLLNLLLKAKSPQDMPRGIDNFRMYSGLSKALRNAEKTGIIELDETQFKFLKDSIEKDTPAAWGYNPDIVKAIEIFMDAKLITEEAK